MKNKATKERRRESEEVVYMFRDEINRLRSFHSTSDEVDQFVNNKIRPLLPYSLKTNNCDIFCSLNRTLHLISKPAPGGSGPL